MKWPEQSRLTNSTSTCNHTYAYHPHSIDPFFYIKNHECSKSLFICYDNKLQEVTPRWRKSIAYNSCSHAISHVPSTIQFKVFRQRLKSADSKIGKSKSRIFFCILSGFVLIFHKISNCRLVSRMRNVQGLHVVYAAAYKLTMK